MFKTSAQLRLENLALRQQLAVLRRDRLDADLVGDCL
jgi:hypothetical protein